MLMPITHETQRGGCHHMTANAELARDLIVLRDEIRALPTYHRRQPPTVDQLRAMSEIDR